MRSVTAANAFTAELETPTRRFRLFLYELASYGGKLGNWNSAARCKGKIGTLNEAKLRKLGQRHADNALNGTRREHRHAVDPTAFFGRSGR